MLRRMRRKSRFPARRIVRDVIIAAGAAAALPVAYVLGTFDGRDARHAERPPPAQSQSVIVKRDPPRASAPLAPPIHPSALVTPALPRWQRNAVHVSLPPGRPIIVLVIDDMGLDRRRSARAVSLPAPLTLSYLPYASELPAQTAAAHAAGHELLVHVPMEPDSAAEDPGPHALRISGSERAMVGELDWMLGRFDGYVGINNHMGSRLTRDPERMATVLTEIKRRGLLFLDSRTTAQTVAADTARHMDVPIAERDVFLDATETPQSVRAQLSELEARARTKGYAIAIGHPRDVTLAALERWIPEARAAGFAFAPLTAVIAPLPRAALSR